MYKLQGSTINIYQVVLVVAMIVVDWNIGNDYMVLTIEDTVILMSSIELYPPPFLPHPCILFTYYTACNVTIN